MRMGTSCSVAVSGILAFCACSSPDSTGSTGYTTGATGGATSSGSGGSGGSSGSTGTGGASGSTGSGGSTTSGGSGTGGSAGTGSGAGGSAAGSGGTSGGSAGAPGGSSGTGGAAGQAPEGGTADAGPRPAEGGIDGDAGTGGNPLTKVVPTPGCGKDPGQGVGTAVRGTIVTMGTKPTGCADSKCGAWTYTREYFVTLPTGYVNTKAYPLVFQGPGCGGTGTAIYPLNNNVDNTVIRVGLTPPDNAIGHATNPNQGCFDDKEGDDSVDWIFYENLWDKLAGVLCFDKNRVFASGNSSGAWFSNEVGCKYAGDATHPIRGIMPNTGGLPTEALYVPTCTNQPMAGMWIHEINDTTNPFTGNKVAIQRAMQVNGCTIGTNYDNAMFDDFPIAGGNPDTTCKKIRGCPDIAPLVVCALAGNGHGSHDNVANPGFATFIKLFSAPPLGGP
jgi:poly(3-hydroxybutyrate) depolymerase